MTYNKDMADNNAIGINYSDQYLRVLIEEYIIQQRRTFTLEGVCNYVLYWAMEDGHTILSNTLYESNQLAIVDCDRVSRFLEQIVREGRTRYDGEKYIKLTV